MYASLMIIVQFEIWGPFMPTCCFSLIFISFIYIHIFIIDDCCRV